MRAGDGPGFLAIIGFVAVFVAVWVLLFAGLGFALTKLLG